MRLIGGNISDTPVKEIGDGSAFSVAGASGASSVLEQGGLDRRILIQLAHFLLLPQFLDGMHTVRQILEQRVSSR